jgi:hypothetical protein
LGQLLEVETNATECGLKGKNVVRRRGKVVGRQGKNDGWVNLFGLIKLGIRTWGISGGLKFGCIKF